MQTCRIVTISGDVFNPSQVTENPFSTLLRDIPYVRILDLRNDVIKSVPLQTIVSAVVTGGECMAAGFLGKNDALPSWKHVYRIYKENRERLMGLPEAERIDAAHIQYAKEFGREDLGIIPSLVNQ